MVTTPSPGLSERAPPRDPDGGSGPCLRFGRALAAPRRAGDDIASLATSAILHTVIIALLWLGPGRLLNVTGETGVGTGIGAGLAGGGGGGGAAEEQPTWIELPEPAAVAAAAEAAAPPELVPLPTAVAVPDPLPAIAHEIAAAADLARAAAVVATAAADAGSGGGAGEGTGTGRGAGTGPGTGGGSGGGEGGGIGSGVGPGSGRGRVLPPSPNRILLPPPAPASLKGRTLVVRLEVDSTGVVRGVELLPTSGDAKYDEKLRKTALGWKFRPARDSSNRPVAVFFDAEFTF